MILFIGQVGARRARPRGLPGGRVPPDVRAAVQVGGADRTRRSHPRVPQPRLPRGHLGPPGPGGAGAARGRAGRDGRGARRAPLPARSQPQASADAVAAGARAPAAPPQPAAGGRGRRRLDARRPPRICAPSSRPTSCPTVASFRCQDYLDNAPPALRRRSGPRRPTRRWPNACATPTSCCWRARAWARPARAATRCSTCRPPGRRWCTSTPTAASSAASTARTWRSTPARPSFFAAARALPPPAPQPRLARLRRGGARRLPGLEHARRRARARCSSARSWRGCATRLPADAIVTNGAGNYTVWVHRYYRTGATAPSSGPTSGSMGYGLPAAVAASLHAPRSHGGLLRRRRLLPDARAGAGHRRPVRRRARSSS